MAVSDFINLKNLCDHDKCSSGGVAFLVGGAGLCPPTPLDSAESAMCPDGAVYSHESAESVGVGGGRLELDFGDDDEGTVPGFPSVVSSPATLSTYSFTQL